MDDLLRNWKEIAFTARCKRTLCPFWSPPPSGFIKLNFDGSSVRNPGPSGIGGVFRNEEGIVTALFSGPIGEGDSLRAEILVALEGIRRAKDLNISRLILEGDSKVVINWLKTEDSGLWNFNNEKKNSSYGWVGTLRFCTAG